jgi:hypothetical protein
MPIKKPKSIESKEKKRKLRQKQKQKQIVKTNVKVSVQSAGGSGGGGASAIPTQFRDIQGEDQRTRNIVNEAIGRAIRIPAPVNIPPTPVNIFNPTDNNNMPLLEQIITDDERQVREEERQANLARRRELARLRKEKKDAELIAQGQQMGLPEAFAQAEEPTLLEQAYKGK